MLSPVNIGGYSGLISRLDETSCVSGAMRSDISVLTIDNITSRATTSAQQPSGKESARAWKEGSRGLIQGPGGRCRRFGTPHWRIARTVDERTGGVRQTPKNVGLAPGLAYSEARYSSL